MNTNLFKKFIQFAIGNGIVLILGFISAPIITRIISPSEMGKFSMFNTITNLLLVIVLLGIDQSYVRYYYEEEDKSQLLKRCIKIPLVVNFIFCALFLIFYKYISIYIVDEVNFLLVVLIVFHLFGSIFSRFALIQIRMKQRAKLYSLLNILMKIFYLIFIAVFFVLYKDSYMTLILATIIANLLMTLFAIYIEKKEWFGKGRNKLKTVDRELIRYGIPFVFSMAVTWIFQSADRIAIKQFCGYDEVGLYSGAMNIISLLNACQGAFTTFWVPVAYEKYSDNPNDTEFFSKINKIVSVVMLLIAILLITFKDLIVLLLGAEYREAVFIFPYLVFMPIMYTISETTVLGINFKKKTKNHIYIAIISAMVNIIGNLILVPIYGAIGAAISTGLAYIVFFATRTFIANKYYKIKLDLGKFAIATCITYVLATYSSFYTFNIGVFTISTLSIIIIILLYKDIFKELWKLINKNFKIKR